MFLFNAVSVYAARLWAPRPGPRLHSQPWHPRRWHPLGAPQGFADDGPTHPVALLAFTYGFPLVTVIVSPPVPPARFAEASPGARVAQALEGAGLSRGGGPGLGPDGEPREAVPGGAMGDPAAASGGPAGAAMVVEAELGARVVFGEVFRALGARLPGGVGGRACQEWVAGRETARLAAAAKNKKQTTHAARTR